MMVIDNQDMISLLKNNSTIQRKKLYRKVKDVKEFVGINYDRKK